MVLVAQD